MIGRLQSIAGMPPGLTCVMFRPRNWPLPKFLTGPLTCPDQNEAARTIEGEQTSPAAPRPSSFLRWIGISWLAG